MAEQLNDHATATAFLAMDHAGRQIVSVHSKISYAINWCGECIRAEAQQPLLLDHPDLPESDVTSFESATDLLVLACAYAPSPRHTQMLASIECGTWRWDCQVSGDRRCSYRGPGAIEFEPPVPFEKIQLCYEHAYGGVDDAVEHPM